MTGSDDRTILPFPNAFTRTFLDRIGELDEPPSAGEADVAGPWEVEDLPGFGFGLFRKGETRNRNFEPVAVFHRRPIALLAAAVLPGTGRDAAFRLAERTTSAGFAVTDSSGQLRPSYPSNNSRSSGSRASASASPIWIRCSR